MEPSNPTLEGSNLTQQGIDAYKAGDKAEAVRLLGEAIRANRQDKNAWLYLGAALDDPVRKRQAFMNVLEIDPANEQAKNALARLDMATSSAAPSGTPGTGSRLGAQANATFNATSSRLNEVWSGKESFKVPGKVEGAPESVTVPFLIENARPRISQAIDIYLHQNFEQIVTAGQNATMWDAVFTAGIGIFVLGAADFVGRVVGWPLTAFYGGLGGLLWAFIAPILLMLATAAGWYGAVYASKAYLENQNVRVSMAQHAMYYSMIFLPLILVNAATALVTNAIPVLACILFPVMLIAGLYSLWLLKAAFDRVYGTTDNRGLLTAAISIAGYIVGYVIALIIGGIFGAVLRGIFGVRFAI